MEWTAAQLLAAAARASGRPSPCARAGEFLGSFLKDGPRTSRDIWTEARRQGLTKRTLERVKRELAIRSVRIWADSKRASYWLLPGQELPKSGESEDDLEKWLAPLRERFPPPTPLDEL